jgi:hypothetical protein
MSRIDFTTAMVRKIVSLLVNKSGLRSGGNIAPTDVYGDRHLICRAWRLVQIVFAPELGNHGFTLGMCFTI